MILTLSSDSLTGRRDFDENDVAKALLSVVSNTNGTNIILNRDPFVLLGVSLG